MNMGYSTSFKGSFSITPPLSKEQTNYLKQFSKKRRMWRDADLVVDLPDPTRLAVGLPIGKDGEYFTGGLGPTGEVKDESILDHNSPPPNQPDLWCDLIPNDEGNQLAWNGAEKTYSFVEWLEYLIDNFLSRWGRELNGIVTWQGENIKDIGWIEIKNNDIRTRRGKLTENR